MSAEKNFQPNNHSAWEVRWIPASAEQDLEVRSLLESAYGYQIIGVVKKVDAWEVRSHNFRVEVSHNGQERVVLVKKNIVWRDAESMPLIERVLSFLHHEEIRVPVIVPALDGKTHVARGEHLWQVFEFIVGNYFCGTEEELVEVARHIARLNVALKSLPFEDEIAKRKKVVADWSPEDFVKHFTFAAGQGGDVYRSVIAQKEFLGKQMTDVMEHRSSMSSASRQVVRNSLHPHDTLFVDGRLQAIIDFEEIGVNELAREIGNACHRFVRQYVVHQGRPWEETLANGTRIFLDAYLAEHSLSTTEIKFMPLFVKDELMRKLHSSLTKILTTEEKQKFEGEALKFIHLLLEADAVGKEMLIYASTLR